MMFKRIARATVFAAGSLGFAAIVAAQGLDKVDLDAERAAIERFQKLDQKLQDVG